MNITCIEPLGIPKEHFECLKAHYNDMGHTFEYYMDRNETHEELVKRMHNADIVIVSNINLPQIVLQQCPQLKYLSVAFTGLDHIDLAYCKNNSIEVQNAAGYSTTAVSELAIGMMIDLLREITYMNGIIREGKSRGTLLGRELKGKTIGIIGTGAIGTATIRLLLAFGCNIIAYNRSQHEEVKSMGVKYTTIENVLKESDIVSLHIPLTEDTRGLINRDLLKMMKSTSLLINTARGPVCDIDAVADALNNGLIAGAAFDVFEHEPPIPYTHPLLTAKNCILTPHIAFATQESFSERAHMVFKHVDEWLDRNC